MTMFPVVSSLYAALLAFLLFGLSVYVIRMRRSHSVALGDGGHGPLVRAMRAQANFTEYVPMAVVLLVLLEFSGIHLAWVHVLGAMLLLGRLSHAYGISKTNEDFRYRVTGMALTFSCLLISASALLYQVILATPR